DQSQGRKAAGGDRGRQPAGHRRRGDRVSRKIKRRDFITLIGGAAAWPLAARAQQPGRVWRIGYLSATETPSEPQAQSRRLIMEAALARLGYGDGKNLIIDRRLLRDQFRRENEAAAHLSSLAPRRDPG